ncbi:MAG: hypothetical protein ACO4AY_01540, partial [Ilumatobacteraceae bacterium]
MLVTTVLVTTVLVSFGGGGPVVLVTVVLVTVVLGSGIGIVERVPASGLLGAMPVAPPAVIPATAT